MAFESTVAFDQIYLTSDKAISRNSVGKLKFAPAGFGWKESSSGQVVTERLEEITSLHWLRSFKDQGFQLRIELSSGTIRVFEGFPSEASAQLTEFIKINYNLPLNLDESSGRGWNWGKLEIFNQNSNSNSKNNNNSGSVNYYTSGKLAFSLPLKDCTNALVATKNELALEFSNGSSVLPVDEKDDIVTELRFYLPDGAEDSDGEDQDQDENVQVDDSAPGTTTSTSTSRKEERMDEDEDGGSSDDNEEEGSSKNKNNSSAPVSLASQILNEIKSLSDFAKVSGEIIAKLPEIACVVPRGRYTIDMFSSFLRLHGKSYDYKIDYTSLQKLFLLPKTDDSHVLLVLALDPPLKQGLTRYPHLIMQFPKEERIEEFILQSMSQAELTSSFGDKLQLKYNDVATFELVSILLRGLAGQKVIVPGSFKSAHTGHPAIKCTIKANEGVIYPLEKNILFIPKPTLLMPHAEIAKCVFSRVGGPTSSFGGNPRSFDLKISLKGSGTEHLFSNIAKEELEVLVEYLRSKQIPFTTEEEGRPKTGKKDLLSESEDEESGSEGAGKRRKINNTGDVGMEEEEEDSTDEEYNEDDDSEGEEEAGDSEEDSDFDSEEESGSDEDEEEEEENHKE